MLITVILRDEGGVAVWRRLHGELAVERSSSP